MNRDAIKAIKKRQALGGRRMTAALQNQMHHRRSTRLHRERQRDDKDARMLLRALNRLPGIRTAGVTAPKRHGVCGVFLDATSLRALAPIVRAIDRNYFPWPVGYGGWSLAIEETDHWDRKAKHQELCYWLRYDELDLTRRQCIIRMDALAACLPQAKSDLDQWARWERIDPTGKKRLAAFEKRRAALASAK